MYANPILAQMGQAATAQVPGLNKFKNLAIDGVNYNNAMNTQKIIDTYNAGRQADMQAYINRLEIEKATAGLLRFPNQWTYAGGVFPPTAATAAAG